MAGEISRNSRVLYFGIKLKLILNSNIILIKFMKKEAGLKPRAPSLVLCCY